MIRIIHICADEKFIDDAITIFDELENVHSFFFVFTNDKEKKLSLVKSDKAITFSSFDEILSITKKSNYNMAMIHSLFVPYYIVLKIQIPIIWSTWGYDIYSDQTAPLKKLFPMSLYKPKTRTLLRNEPVKISFKFTKYATLLTDRLHKFKEQQRYSRIVKKTSFFSTVLPIEFDKIKQKNPKALYCPFHYISKPNSISFHPAKISLSPNRILLGNSNDPTNNHFDVLEKLNALNTPLEIIIPFSYPFNGTEYYKRVIEVSERFENLNITFLKNFIEKSKYFQLTDSCSSAIFGHIRQQAVGNIVHCLMTGKKVFFYEDSVLFRYYRDLGYTIFSIEKDLNKKTLELELPSSKKENNKKKCIDEWDYNKQLKELQLFFHNLASFKK